MFGLRSGTWVSYREDLCCGRSCLNRIKTWRTFLQSRFRYALVLEDDISFDPRELSEMIRLLMKPEQALLWDINNFEIKHNGFPLTIKQSTDGHLLSLYLTPVTHTGAYLINRKAAKALLEKALPIKMPVDHYFTRVWELSLKFTGIELRLVQQTYGDSEIGAISSRDKDCKNCRHTSFYRALYVFQSQVIRFFYNLKVYGQGMIH